MNRSTLSLIGAVTALAAVTGIGAVTAPGGEPTTDGAAAKRLPVERSTLACPQPSDSALAETDYAAFTPKGKSDEKGNAALSPAEPADPGDPKGKDEQDDKGDEDDKDRGQEDSESKDRSDKPVLSLEQPGQPVTASTQRADAPALTGTADGRFAPGWTVQQTTTVSAGDGRGLHGMSCAAPDADFWIPGASTADERRDYVHLTNPDDLAAVVDLELYDKDGAVETEAGREIIVPPGATVPVLLSTLTARQSTNVTVHVVARTGRVSAQVRALDEKLGGDWVRPSAVPGPRAVLPGIPGDATSVRLVVMAPGSKDADLRVRLAGKSGEITPAGHGTLHVRAGTTAAVDLDELTRGQAGSLVLSPSEEDDATPVVAAARVTREKGSERETAFIPATTPIQERGTAAGSRSKGSTVHLTAPDEAAKVRVTSSAGSEGGSPRTKTYTVRADTTLAVRPPAPKGGEGAFAVTVERRSGGSVYASRMLEREEDGVPMFTVQSMPDDRGTVAVPEAGPDLSVLGD
ncbi:DUF5719 family protein [Streptomyces oceani]|uniref:Secreted protein n=1 Tax=Streptomyces oceani TaxID=1075402 RepID=A0A1E7KNL3_9ACTN|nr:DUF5719 family protein [Streptomyces oceani]OEV05474.1 hypothetical protein AN216_03165 [Streptomyces oceani]